MLKFIMEVMLVYIILLLTVGRRTLWRVSPLYRKLMYPLVFVYVFINVDRADTAKKIGKLPATSIRRSILEALYEEEYL